MSRHIKVRSALALAASMMALAAMEIVLPVERADAALDYSVLASPREDYVVGRGWLPGSTITATVDDPANGVGVDLTGITTSCDGCQVAGLDWQISPSEWVPGPGDLQPGSTLVVTDGTTTRTAVIQNVGVDQVDTVGSTSSGVGPVGEQLNVTLNAGFGQELGSWQVTVSETGHWVFSFAVEGFNLQAVGSGYVAVFTPTVDGVRSYNVSFFSAPREPEITVTPNSGLTAGDMVRVTGSGFYANETFSLRMGAGFIGGDAPETGMPVQADMSGNFSVDYWVSRVINAKADPWQDLYHWVDCAVTDECFIATFYASQGSYGYAEVEFVPTSVTMTLATTGLVSKAGGVATVSGTVTCPALPYPGPVGERAAVTGSLYQRAGRKAVATGTFVVPPIVCTGSAVGWTADVVPAGSVPFATGDAELRATAVIVTVGSNVPNDAETVVVKLATPKVPKNVR